MVSQRSRQPGYFKAEWYSYRHFLVSAGNIPGLREWAICRGSAFDRRTWAILFLHLQNSLLYLSYRIFISPCCPVLTPHLDYVAWTYLFWNTASWLHPLLTLGCIWIFTSWDFGDLSLPQPGSDRGCLWPLVFSVIIFIFGWQLPCLTTDHMFWYG